MILRVVTLIETLLIALAIYYSCTQQEYQPSIHKLEYIRMKWRTYHDTTQSFSKGCLPVSREKIRESGFFQIFQHRSEGQKVEFEKIMKNVKIGKTRISLRATMGEDETDRIWCNNWRLEWWKGDEKRESNRDAHQHKNNFIHVWHGLLCHYLPLDMPWIPTIWKIITFISSIFRAYPMANSD